MMHIILNNLLSISPCILRICDYGLLTKETNCKTLVTDLWVFFCFVFSTGDLPGSISLCLPALQSNKNAAIMHVSMKNG